MELNLRFVTPLWTGDVTAKARGVVPAAIVGSLRWWYEVLIRGLGGWACDPTDDRQRCPGRDTVKIENVQTVLCPACQLFGATGWAKRFSISAVSDTHPGAPPAGAGNTVHECDAVDPRGRHPRFYFPLGQVGGVTLRVLPRRRSEDEDAVRVIAGLLDFVRRNAGLGAKTNLGYGVFDWQPGAAPSEIPGPGQFVELVNSAIGSHWRRASSGWPKLHEMFFATVKLPSRWTPKQFVNLKCNLRADFRRNPVQHSRLRHFLLGTTRDGTQASKVKMALMPDLKTLRVWGWVPAHLPGSASRRQVLDVIHRRLATCGTVEPAAAFDELSVTPQKYLEVLMGGGH